MFHNTLTKYRHSIAGVLVLCLLTFSGCVYYNTFYNAKKAFNKAEGDRKSSKYGKPRINQSLYKTAIEKSLKIIEDYPNSKYYDDALYVLAVSYFYTEKYPSADRRFRELLANYGDSKFAKESELYLAKTKLQLREEKEAMEIFEKIFTAKSEKSFKAEAAMGLGNFYLGEKDYAQAQPYFLAVRDSLGNDEQKKIAQRNIADGYYNIFRFRDALGAYLQIIGLKPDKEETYHAYYRAAECAFSLMRIKDGMSYLNTLIEDDVYFDSLGVIKLLQARGFEYENDLDAAEEIYFDIASEEQNKRVAGEAYYNLGLIYQFDHDDLTKAKEYYDKTVELARSTESGKDALQRSSDIGKIATFARKLQVDSTVTQEMIDEAAYTQYQLAELYWFSLNKPDSAIMEMQYLVDSFPTSYDAPRGLISLSQMYREYRADSVTADALLRKVTADYPRSDFVAQALELLHLKETEVDTGYAKRYLDKAEFFFVDEENIDSARYYYQYIVDNFPESNYYVQARFSLLWLTETYNPPGDSSLIFAYNDFIDSFPNSSWAKEASNRLKGQPKRERRADDDSEGDTTGVVTEPGAEGDTTGAAEDTAAYIDPLVAVYIGPDGEKAENMPLEPIQTRELFVYPTESYRSRWEGDLYFQIFLDFSGEVSDYILKIRSGDEAIDREASRIIESMVFDVQKIPLELQGAWLVYQYKVRLPDHLR